MVKVFILRVSDKQHIRNGSSRKIIKDKEGPYPKGHCVCVCRYSHRPSVTLLQKSDK